MYTCMYAMRTNTKRPARKNRDWDHNADSDRFFDHTTANLDHSMDSVFFYLPLNWKILQKWKYSSIIWYFTTTLVSWLFTLRVIFFYKFFLNSKFLWLKKSQSMQKTIYKNDYLNIFVIEIYFIFYFMLYSFYFYFYYIDLLNTCIFDSKLFFSILFCYLINNSLFCLTLDDQKNFDYAKRYWF